jgi:prepilin-type N-terminal cleavage/methylation domain-containing protein
MKGFTLIEVLLSIAIIGIMTAISIPVFYNYQIKNDTYLAVSTIVQSLRRAQILTQAVEVDAAWGVKVQQGGIVLFKGTTYSSRDVSFDEVFDMSTTIIPSGLSEVVFNKMTGLPMQIGNITLTSNVNQSKSLTINSKGMIDY